MKILIREGSAARNFEELFPLMLEDPESCMLCCDDKHPDGLMKGHINLLVQRAVAKGMDVMKVLRCASFNAVRHYGLEVGLLSIGDPADFIVVNDLKEFLTHATYINGVCVAKENKAIFSRIKPKCINRFACSKKLSSDFKINARLGKLRVIGAIDGELITDLLEMQAKVHNDEVVSDLKHDILKITVVNRYTNAPPSVGFIKNFGLKKGALSSSVAHDSHNILAVGTNDEYLCKAVNCIVQEQGGIAVVDDEEELCLPLPIAGLMSDLEGHEVASRYHVLEAKAKSLGCTLSAPFTTLSFMALLVIPRLKISDRGLFDTQTFSFIEIFSGLNKL
jgi:adenine deaminase